MSDIEFHIGPKKCGKSEYIENQLQEYKYKIYIATLPVIPEYFKTIEVHQIRRNFGWQTYELMFDFEQDIKNIKNLLLSIPENSACMLDGILTWYILLKRRNDKIISPEKFVDGIKGIIDISNNIWRLVDVDLLKVNSDGHDLIELRLIHQILIEELKINKIICWDYEQIQNSLD
jgi:adenosyl cobinamide kinase/adenosyl cobinamide phosphate guanylyltransferase